MCTAAFSMSTPKLFPAVAGTVRPQSHSFRANPAEASICCKVAGTVRPQSHSFPLLRFFFDNFTCGLQTEGAIACWGRCIELIRLHLAGLRAEATARHPDNQWPINLDIDPKQRAMSYSC